MRNQILAAVGVAAVLFTNPCGLAQEQTAATTELKELMTKVTLKLKELRPPSPPGTPRKMVKITEADMADELKQFDALLAKHKGEKTDEVAQILYMKSILYTQVLSDANKGEEVIAQLRNEFPDSRQVANLKKQDESKRIQDALVVGSKFPDFNENDLVGQPLSVANYKGKVVLIDFWATWCGPCVAELPNVLKAYEKHHAKGFEIIGISLDRQQDKAKLENFIKEKNMPWQQFYDGQYWNNKLSTKYGVNSIPATYLLDGEGKIIGKNLRGTALEEAVAKALGKS